MKWHSGISNHIAVVAKDQVWQYKDSKRCQQGKAGYTPHPDKRSARLAKEIFSTSVALVVSMTEPASFRECGIHLSVRDAAGTRVLNTHLLHLSPLTLATTAKTSGHPQCPTLSLQIEIS